MTKVFQKKKNFFFFFFFSVAVFAKYRRIWNFLDLKYPTTNSWFFFSPTLFKNGYIVSLANF